MLRGRERARAKAERGLKGKGENKTEGIATRCHFLYSSEKVNCLSSQLLQKWAKTFFFYFFT